ncbi:MAG: hypothetical protein ABW096_05625 [Candidatus Thiodiazotropha sp.]
MRPTGGRGRGAGWEDGDGGARAGEPPPGILDRHRSGSESAAAAAV